MFGTWRLGLAILVVVAHLTAEHRYAWVGTYAVQSFFVLSGYLMTLILQEKYGFSLAGFQSFVVNRVLRIFPSYFTALAVTLGCLLVLGGSFTQNFHPLIRWPADWSEWWPNLTIIGLTNQHPVRLVPPAWALDIELVFYLLIAVIFGRSRGIGLAWFALSLMYTLFHQDLWPMDFPRPRYLNHSLPFATGSLIYHFRQLSPVLRSARTPQIIASFAVWCVPFAANLLERTDPYSKIYQVNMIASALLVLSLADVRPAAKSFWAKWDKHCGDLSYPVYLLHWQAALICLSLLPISPRGWITVAAALPMTLLLAKLEVYFVSGPIEAYRHNVQKRQQILSASPVLPVPLKQSP